MSGSNQSHRKLNSKGITMAFKSGNSTTLISEEADIVGDIHFSGDLEIQGLVRGNLIAKSGSKALVRVVDGGRVEGEIHAPRIMINGSVVGNVYATEHVELAAKAMVEGNVNYAIIEMVKGAQVNGSLVYAADSPSPESTSKATATDSQVEA